MFIKMLLLLVATFGLNNGQKPASSEKFEFEWREGCQVTLVFAKAETTYEDLLLLDGRILPRHPHTSYSWSEPVILEEGTTFRFEMLEVAGLEPSVLITGTTQFNIHQGYSGGGTLHRSDQFDNGTEAVEIHEEWVGSFGIPYAPEPIFISVWPYGVPEGDLVVLPIRVMSCHD